MNAGDRGAGRRKSLAALSASFALALLGCSPANEAGHSISSGAEPSPIAAASTPLTPSAGQSGQASATARVVTITPIPDAPPSGNVIHVMAKDVRWSPTILAAPAGKGWTIAIDNRDGPPEHHNFVVASGPTVPERIYQSRNFNKGSFTFEVPALPAGTYLFICTVHPDVMTGTLTVR